MQKILLATVFIIGLFSCYKQQNEKYPPLPEALQQEVNAAGCVCDPYINLYRWRNMNIYLLGYKGPTCNWIPTYYKTDSNAPLQMAPGYTLDAFLGEATLLGNVWSCNTH